MTDIRPAATPRTTTLLRAARGLLLSFLLLFGLAWTLTAGEYPVPQTVARDKTLPVIEANGFRFHGETFGDAASPALIVVHGGPGWDYRSLLPLKSLADDYHVIFYDQRGSGLSPRVPAREQTLETALADLDAMVDNYRRDDGVVMVGHSWGAMLVAAYLGRQPEKVSRAILAEPGFLNAEMLKRAGLRLGPRWEPGYLWFAATRWFESLHIPDREAARDYFLGEVASRANPEYYCDEVIPEAGLERWRAGATAMGAMLNSARDDDWRPQFDFTSGLKRYRRPVLLLASECNRFIGIDQQRRHAAYFNAAELVIIPRSGHMMFAEQPEASVAAVRAFLKTQ